jgi:2-keto-4-pentenoate hydratase/2-oxohepta-3-ene-1,7-dioic acid hydratase in catechol pathway
MSWHALGSFRRDGVVHPALVFERRPYDLGRVWDLLHPRSSAPGWTRLGVAAQLEHWPAVCPALGQLAAAATAQSADYLASAAVDLSQLVAPFVPARVFCAASNFVEHANEMGTVLAAKADSKPYMFLKTASSVIGPGDIVRIPPETEKPDWEVELAAVIGHRVRRVPVERALDCVAGYTIVNDVSARDLTRRSDYPFKHDWFQGKNHDTFCPLGPWIVPAALIADPQSVGLKLTVNGEAMQESTTAEMIWTVAEQISYLSTIVTLMPGDVIATGTPTGVGMGRGIFLKAGDVMVASVEHIGDLRNPVEAEAA